eukprot:TRINITY_DN3500_c0_g2_i1.p1 TRINITY_DN3500_c0_g2~~TRINITY_DN3500_c0_g2_i1.p1  ORF type:complete len:259 (-),score=11.58 TRINITY_DN3500_c0_g2_i1:30-806(-)
MNLAKIEAHNSDKTQTYRLGVTQFADLTQEEFAAVYLTTKVNEKFTREEFSRTVQADEKLVGDVDWTSQGKVSEIKNQGACGSCWAFSTTGSIESALMIQGKSVLLSEQQLVDCSRSYGNQGCNGGWMDSAFQYVRDHGLSSQDEYPYRAVNQQCQKDSGDTKISGFVDVPGCSNLDNALTRAPISVAVDATNWSLYAGGVFSNCAGNINHGVLVVGSNNDYWKIKNSWGTGWGESGFIRLAKGNTCAVCNYPSYPTL